MVRSAGQAPRPAEDSCMQSSFLASLRLQMIQMTGTDIEGAERKKMKEEWEERTAGSKSEFSIGPSLPLPDASTTPTRASLTSLFRWEAVTLAGVAELEEVGHFATWSSVGGERAVRDGARPHHR